MTSKRYQWAAVGDINAFFGLMLDNVVNLVVLAGILVGVFGFPAQFIFTHMFPGTALGVMFGDLVYTWLAFRLAKKEGRSDVTAMPLGLDAPSTIGMAFAVIGPAFSSAKETMSVDDAALHAWYVAMATMVLIGIFKLGMSFVGSTIQRIVPQAGLLGTLGGIGIALLGCLSFGELFEEPIVAFLSLGLILYSLVAKLKLPFNLPSVLVAIGLGTAAFYLLGYTGLSHSHFNPPHTQIYEYFSGLLSGNIAFPLPSLGFAYGMREAVTTYLPVAIPFAILTVVGGINVNESARLAGDDYSTRDILLTEAVATLLAGVCGGVSQSTPYIGHPAYKAMGGRAAYTLATGLFIGLGGIFGYISLLAGLLPKPALMPILIFVALDIVEQSFHAVPKRYAGAVGFAMLPNISQLVLIIIDQFQTKLRFGITHAARVANDTGLPGFFVDKAGIFVVMAHGFILTGMLWGAFVAFLVDRKAVPAAICLGICAVLSAFGVIHSVLPTGGVYLPWSYGPELAAVGANPGEIFGAVTLTASGAKMTAHFTIGYALLAGLVLALGFTREFREAPPAEQAH